MSTYTENGYNNRRDYLEACADDFGVPVSDVFALAGMLGPNEDFDGLITSLEDYVDQLEWD